MPMEKQETGILPDSHIEKLFAEGALKTIKALDDDQIQPGKSGSSVGRNSLSGPRILPSREKVRCRKNWNALSYMSST